MNKSIRIIGMAALVLLLVVSCKKENQDGSRKVTLKAGMDTPSGKTHIDEDWVSYWDEGDQIRVNGNLMYMEKMQAENTWATFSCDNWQGPVPGETPSLYAIAPAAEQISWTNTDGKTCWKSRVVIPATQSSDFYKTNLPQGVLVEDHATTLNFHNLVNIYRLPVYTDGAKTITKVTMENKTANNPYPLVADIWYPHFGTDWANVEIESSSYTITLTCNETVSTNQSTPTYFHFVAFPVPWNDVEFKLYNGENLVATITKHIDDANSIEYSRVYTLYSIPEAGNLIPWKI